MFSPPAGVMTSFYALLAGEVAAADVRDEEAMVLGAPREVVVGLLKVARLLLQASQ